MSNQKSLLVVDANVISHALTPNQTKAYADLFRELEKNYKFVVTGYTQYELMCSSDKKHQKIIKEYISNEMTLVALSHPLMIFSARLHNLYAKHKSTAGKKISVGDITNAALAIIKGCPVLTIDNNDFPRPFFMDIDRKRVRFTSNKNRETIDTIYILGPDIENIKECFKSHEI